MWFSNWLVTAPSMVQCPELCTRGAISLANSVPPTSKSSIASTPTWSRSSSRRAGEAPRRAGARSLTAGAGARLTRRIPPSWVFSTRGQQNTVSTLLMFTSGTTGEPKGVMHTHNSLVAAIAPLPERLGVNSDSIIHMASTVAHLTGLLYGIRLQTQIGATGVYQDVWSNERFVELIGQHKITITSAATPFLHDTLNAPNIDAHDVSSLVRFCCFGAPIPPAIVRQAKQRWPELAVINGRGQTEDALVTLGIPGDSEEKVAERSGYPLPGMQIRVVDEVGTVLPADTDGRLQVTGPFLFAGYAKRLDITRELFDGRWFDTGDIARIDPDGYLKISGRTKDVIIRGGENIPVAYVENALYENPKIASVAVVGIPDPRLQERACACVVLKPGIEDFTFTEMQQFLNDKGLARQYWPESLQVMAELPSTSTGKIQKFRLREAIMGAS